MAGETLGNASDLLAGLPDNQAGLIAAVDSRNVVVSVTPAVGWLEDDPAQVPYTIPMTDGVPVDVLGTLVAPVFFGNFWKLDGANRFIPSYTDFGVVVPAATFRLNSGSVLINLEKAGGGTADYEFQGTQGGTFTGDPLIRTIGTAPALYVFGGDRLYDVSLAEPVSFSITPLGHSDDLIVNDVRVSLVGNML